MSWGKDFIIQANLRISLDEPLLNNLIKVLGEVANRKLMRTADGTKLGSVLRAVDDRSNTGDWERLELGIEIKKMRFLHEKQQADTSGRKYCAKQRRRPSNAVMQYERLTDNNDGPSAETIDCIWPT